MDNSELNEDGFIALDDVILKDRHWGSEGSCDFEHDMCSWLPSLSEMNATWLRHRGDPANSEFGPHYDNTLGELGLGKSKVFVSNHRECARVTFYIQPIFCLFAYPYPK